MPIITIKLKGFGENDKHETTVVIDVIIHRIDGDSVITKTITLDDPTIEIIGDDLYETKYVQDWINSV